jgi:hypothetical protein
MVSLESISKYPTTKRLTNAVISEGQIVNVVSNNYGLVENQQLYTSVETKLIMADVKYEVSSQNRLNKQFAVDYIIDNGIQRIGDKDIIQPLLRFTNSYDGSCKTIGTFGLFRRVCSNGLHIAQSEVQFAFKHTKKNAEILLPKIDELINEYLNTEYYELNKKINQLSEIEINPIDFTKTIADKTGLYSYEKNVRNTERSEYANKIINTIFNESEILGVSPTAWIGYNAVNQILHDELRFNFNKKQEKDADLFEFVLNMA